MNRPQWHLAAKGFGHLEEPNEPAGADLIDPLIMLIDALRSVNWPHVLLAALTGFVVGALTFWGLT